jgi:UDP:flavonoid glycosyltransferase YjiC (YdhE family)
MKNKIMIAFAAYNWAETHRMISIGEEFLNNGYEVYALGEGKYDFLLKNVDFHRVYVNEDKKWYTNERKEKLMKMDIYGNNYCTENELRKIINEEIKIINSIDPKVIITGYRTTLSVSAKITKTPLVWVLSAVVSKKFFEGGFASIPENRGGFFKKLKSNDSKKYSKLVLNNNSSSKIWNNILIENNLPIFKSDIDIFEGDINLLSDAPELFPFIVPSKKYQFTYPLINNNEIAMPKGIDNFLNKQRLSIFITLGSSGNKQLFLKILDCLKKIDASIIVAKTNILKDSDIQDYPKNYFFAESFPHIDIAKKTDLSIIHGGQGTIYSTLIAGKPFIGIPLFSEQQYNLEVISKMNSGICLLQKELNEENLISAINQIIKNKKINDNAKKLSKIIYKYYKDPDYSANKRAYNIIKNSIIDTK